MNTKIKKITALILILCMTLSIVACSKSKDEQEEAVNERMDLATEEEFKESESMGDASSKEDSLVTNKEPITSIDSSESIDTSDGDVYEDVGIRDEATGSDSSISSEVEGGLIKGEAATDDFMGGGSASGEVIIPSSPESPDVIETPEILPSPELPIETIKPQAGTLTAGEWNDNENYDFLLKLISDQGTYSNYVTEWKYSLIKKMDVKVMGEDAPFNNAKVTLVDKDNKTVATAYTDINGMAYLYVNSNKKAPKKCVVTAEREIKEFEIDAKCYTKVNEVTLGYKISELEKTNPKQLDLCFVIDTTGSMMDELIYLQAELENVINKVHKDNKDVDIRLSVNFYRDKGDEYITKTFDFSDDIEKQIELLNEQMCNGGGDYPEAVHTALDEAVNKLSWRENSTKLMFFVLDAPAHGEDENVVASLQASIDTACDNGIRIIPIASSGVDKSTEFMLRGMAAITNGTYTFLTDDSGVGGAHIEPSIGEYEVYKLNELLIKLINDRI